MSVEELQVVAAAILDSDGAVLINQRPAGRQQAGRWEFPGGKLEPGEPPEQGLRRELSEELGIEVLASRPLIRISHDYPSFRVRLDVRLVLRFRGTPLAHDGQTLRWVRPDDLPTWDLLEADWPVVTALRLPTRMLVTPTPDNESGFIQALERSLESGIRLVQFRAHGLTARARRELAGPVLRACRRVGARMLVNGAVDEVTASTADGLHLTADALWKLDARPLGREFFVGASCHNREDLLRVRALGLDYAVLGPVCATPSHPARPGIGWEAFKRMAGWCGIPVYAIGGLGSADIGTAQNYGAHGVAAIRAFWEG